jgi:hypothetical protein
MIFRIRMCSIRWKDRPTAEDVARLRRYANGWCQPGEVAFVMREYPWQVIAIGGPDVDRPTLPELSHSTSIRWVPRA